MQTMETKFRLDRRVPPQESWHQRRRKRQLDAGLTPDPMPAKGISKKVIAYARLNRGRWLVDCPFADCNSAQYASESDRRFHCTDCLNADAGGAWISVIWPADKERAEIEKHCLARPGRANQNWRPGETIQSLVADNYAHDTAAIGRALR